MGAMSNKLNANFVSLGTDFIVDGIHCIQSRLRRGICSSATLLKAQTVTEVPSVLSQSKHSHFTDHSYIKQFIKLCIIKANVVTLVTAISAKTRVWGISECNYPTSTTEGAL